MPEIAHDFPHLNDMDQTALLARQSALTAQAPNGDFKQLSDEALQELVMIARVLRRRTSAPKSVSGSKKVVPTLGML